MVERMTDNSKEGRSITKTRKKKDVLINIFNQSPDQKYSKVKLDKFSSNPTLKIESKIRTDISKRENRKPAVPKQNPKHTCAPPNSNPLRYSFGKKEYEKAVKRIHTTVQNETDIYYQHEEDKKYLTVNYMVSSDGNNKHDYVKRLEKVSGKIGKLLFI